jgi:hypothetical protein
MIQNKKDSAKNAEESILMLQLYMKRRKNLFPIGVMLTIHWVILSENSLNADRSSLFRSFIHICGITRFTINLLLFKSKSDGLHVRKWTNENTFTLFMACTNCCWWCYEYWTGIHRYPEAIRTISPYVPGIWLISNLPTYGQFKKGISNFSWFYFALRSHHCLFVFLTSYLRKY